jgi:hypothetical protein
MGLAVDPEEGLGELMSLWLAESADALHRVLVLHPHVRQNADAFEPMALLEKHHATEPGTSVATAILLLTDRRWRGAVAQLVRRIADSRVLSGEQLDALAATFLGGRPLRVLARVGGVVPRRVGGRCPCGPWRRGLRGDRGERRPHRGGSAACAPLRRWAASHLLSEDPAVWPRLLTRAQNLEARHAAAVVARMFDSIGSLPAAAQLLLVIKGKTWPHHDVRRAALEVIATRDGADVAFQLAYVDSNAKIRAGAETLVRPSPLPQASDVGESHRDQNRSTSENSQATLF